MQKVVLIHGMSCRFDDCFGKELKKKLVLDGQYKIMEPIFTLTKDITLDSWFKVMDGYKNLLDNNTIYVCHSLGTLFIIRYLFANKLKAKAIICVAGGYLKKPEPPLDYLSNFIPNEKEFQWSVENCPNRYNIFNKDDHIWTQDQIVEYNKRLQVSAIELPRGGHFGRSSDVKDIPEIYQILKKYK